MHKSEFKDPRCFNLKRSTSLRLVVAFHGVINSRVVVTWWVETLPTFSAAPDVGAGLFALNFDVHVRFLPAVQWRRGGSGTTGAAGHADHGNAGGDTSNTARDDAGEDVDATDNTFVAGGDCVDINIAALTTPTRTGKS